MRVIDAVWEKRNLGVMTQELTVEPQDSVEDFRNELELLNADYQVLKIPAGRVDLMWKAEEFGFRFMETTIHVTRELKSIEMPPLLARIDKSIDYEPMNESDLNELYAQIREGLFYTDRIYLDPQFSKEQAANRYIGWISDEISRGCDVFKYIYKGTTIGFFMLKETEPGVYYPFLAGVYPQYQKNVFGAIFNYKPMIEAARRGGKMISTFISTNNSNTVRMHVECGFQFKEITYVYVKHA